MDEVDQVNPEDEDSEPEAGSQVFNMQNTSLPMVHIKTTLRMQDHIWMDIEASASAYRPDVALEHARSAFSAALAGANLIPRKDDDGNDK